MQFGNYDQEGLYRAVINTIAGDLDKDSKHILLIAICLTDEDNGFLYPHDDYEVGEGDLIRRNDLYRYSGIDDINEFCNLFDGIVSRELISSEFDYKLKSEVLRLGYDMFDTLSK